MSKIKEQMLTEEFYPDFQMMQKALFEDMVENGSPNTEFPPLSPFALGGGGLKAGNNFFFPSTTGIISSVASKPETLILNAQARQNITTKEKKLKALPSTNTIQNYHIQEQNAHFYWNVKKDCVEEMALFQFKDLAFP